MPVTIFFKPHKKQACLWHLWPVSVQFSPLPSQVFFYFIAKLLTIVRMQNTRNFKKQKIIQEYEMERPQFSFNKL